MTGICIFDGGFPRFGLFAGASSVYPYEGGHARKSSLSRRERRFERRKYARLRAAGEFQIARVIARAVRIVVIVICYA